MQWQLLISSLAGLGIFLFGISVLEEALEKVAGNKLKKILAKTTSSNIKAFFSGFVATSILQSSTAVALIILSFVSIGVLSLNAGIGIIIGTNLGTAFSTAVISIIGFKFDITLFALPLIAIGGIVGIFYKHSLINHLSKVFVGFGLLFFGLGMIKDNLSPLAHSIDIVSLVGNGVFIPLLIGLFITLLVQSSTASSALVLVSVLDGQIPLKTAFAIIIGVNVGSALSTAIAGFVGSDDKKRLALIHCLFNIFTGALFLIFLQPSTTFIIDTLQIQDPITAVVSFHVLFNLVGALIFIWLVNILATISQKIIPSKTKTYFQYIRESELVIVEPALQSIKLEISALLERTSQYLENIFSLSQENEDRKSFEVLDSYSKLKEYALKIVDYTAKLDEDHMEDGDIKSKDLFLDILRNVLQMLKMIKDTADNLEEIKESDNEFLQSVYRQFQLRIKNILTYYQDLFPQKSTSEIHDTIYLNLSKEAKSIVSGFVKALHKTELSTDEGKDVLTINQSVYAISESFLDILKKMELVENWF